MKHCIRWGDEIGREAMGFWRKQPNKLMFLVLLFCWVVLFHFWGNTTFGYVKTPSLFGWMHYVFWNNPDDQHGLIIPFVVLVLFWWKRDELMQIATDIWPPAIGIIAVALLIHVIGFFVQQTRISIVAFFLGVYGFIGLAWGREFMRRSFFPMFLFMFCVPLGSESDRITLPLRAIATKLTGGIASDLLGIEVVREGTRLFSAKGGYQYEVAAACSGIRSLTAIFAVTAIYGFVVFKKSWKRLALILLAFPLAVVGNVLRLMLIILAAEFFGQDGGNYVHENSWLSLLPYVPAIIGVMVIGHVLREPEPLPLPSANPTEPQQV